MTPHRLKHLVPLRPVIRFLGLLAILTLSSKCSATIHPSPAEAFHSQTEQGGLVVGCVVLEDYGRIVDTPLYVTLACRSEGRGTTRLITVVTDSMGYFAVSNAAAGEYWYYRVQRPEQPMHLQADNRGWYDKYGWFEQYSPNVYPPFVPDRVSRLKAQGGLDLGYLVLIWTRPVEDYQFSRLDSVRVFSDKSLVLNRPSVPEYLLTQYSTSLWNRWLQSLIPDRLELAEF